MNIVVCNGVCGFVIFMSALFSGSALIAAEPAPALVYTPAEGDELSDEARTNIKAFLDGLTPLMGEVKIPSAKATLQVPETHYYLDAEDAHTVLEQAWGNPPDEKILGMIFERGATPLDYPVWGAVISYNDDGYISDADAAKINYDKMLKDLKKSTSNANAWRTENGYASITLVGWAETPAYNAETKKMYWAKEIDFSDSDNNTLNYDIRVLGRRGALVISFVADMSQLSDIRETAPTVLEMAHFDPGATYAEYQPGVDTKAAYGVAGLIGGAAIAKKTGLLAGILLFGKKFFVFILAGLAGLFGAVKKMFGSKSDA